MFIDKITVENYRNYINQTVEFSRETNILYGNNAQGKTNLLEAVSLFSSGKSHRRTPDRDLIMKGCERARAEIEFFADGREQKCEIVFNNGKNKLIKLNGAALTKTSELLGVFKSVIFCPEELSLISGAPEGRRHFMDLHISSQRALYYNILKRYLKILKQKNNLLKRADERVIKTLSVWNEELSAAGAKIMLYREGFLEKLVPVAIKIHEEMSKGEEKLEIRYAKSVQCDEKDEKKLKERIFEAMEKRAQTEITLGMAIVGTHRDDLEFFINGIPCKGFASQGQQKTAVISLKTALTELIEEESGEAPVFLLDDVMSELDVERRKFLSEKIKGLQKIVTCTDKEISEDKNTKYFYVEKGKIT